MPQSGTPYELNLDENGQPDMKEYSMTLEGYIDERKSQLDARDKGVTYEDNMQQKDMNNMMKKDMKMLPDTGESDQTMLLAGVALLFAGITLSLLSYKRKKA